MLPQRLLVLFALFSNGAYAQWLNFPTPGVPRMRDGKPNLTAPAPRTADGNPDLSGVVDQRFFTGKERLPFVGEPRGCLAHYDPDPLRVFPTLPRLLFRTINSSAAWDACWLPAGWATTKERQARSPAFGSPPGVRKLAQKPATSSTDKGTTTRFGVLTRNRLSAGRGRPAPSNAGRQ